MTLTTTDEFSPQHWTDVVDLQEEDNWILDGLIHRNTTLFYGESESGKSSLVSLLVGSLVTGKPFLGKEPHRIYSVAVCWTDDGGDSEYKSRIREVLPEGLIPDVRFFRMPVMYTHDQWVRLFDSVTGRGYDFVVIDNHSQALNGPVNQDPPNRDFFNGVRLFTHAGIPVVIVTHSSDKAYEGHKSTKPMGHSYITQAVRWHCFVSRKRDDITLTFAGNHARPHEMKLTQTGRMSFELRGAKSAEQLTSEAQKRARKRDSDRMDQNARQAAWVVQNCQGHGVNATAKLLAAEHGKTEASMKQHLNRTLGAMLSRTGEGPHTIWTLKE